MADYSKYRITGYVGTIVIHVSNIIYMTWLLEQVKHLPELSTFVAIQPRYFTCWNFALQIMYAFLSLYCELYILSHSNEKKFMLSRSLLGLRDVLFSAIIFPSTIMISTGFWFLYNVDRELIFPNFADKAVPPLSNHIIHSLIVPITIWEIVFRPRETPKSHRKNLSHLGFYLFVYLNVMIYTYYEHGMWIYPILTHFYPTQRLYFVITLVILVLICYVAYYLQWILTRLVWGTQKTLKIR